MYALLVSSNASAISSIANLPLIGFVIPASNALFGSTFIFLILGDDALLGYTGFEWQYDKERYIKTTAVLALIALTVGWLRRK